VEEATEEAGTPRRRLGEPEVNPHVAEVEEFLRRFFGTRVVVKHKRNNKGQIQIDYFNIADLNRILSLLENK
jgi:hypothetical protein